MYPGTSVSRVKEKLFHVAILFIFSVSFAFFLKEGKSLAVSAH
jgi:hypothetical protein